MDIDVPVARRFVKITDNFTLNSRAEIGLRIAEIGPKCKVLQDFNLLRVRQHTSAARGRCKKFRQTDLLVALGARPLHDFSPLYALFLDELSELLGRARHADPTLLAKRCQ